MSDRLQPGSPEEAGFDPEQIERIKGRCAGWVEAGRTDSLAVLAARRGTVVLDEAYGRDGYEDDAVSLSTDAVFMSASIAKPVTATLIMMLVEDGRLGLNHPVQRYIPELRGERKDQICVHHLLTHTSGWWVGEYPLPEPPPLDELPPRDPRVDPELYRRLCWFYELDLVKKPGEQMIYENFNFAVLGEIVRRISGASLGEFARKRLFEPLGMMSTSLGLTEKLAPRLVRRSPESGMAQAAEEFLRQEHGGVSLVSTTSDLAAFAQMTLNKGRYGGKRLLSRGTVEQMTTNQIPGVGCVNFVGRWCKEASWGLGWSVTGDARWPFSQGGLAPKGTVYHGGGGSGLVWVDFKNEVIGVYLTVVEMVDGTTLADYDLYQNMVTAAVD